MWTMESIEKFTNYSKGELEVIDTFEVPQGFTNNNGTLSSPYYIDIKYSAEILIDVDYDKKIFAVIEKVLPRCKCVTFSQNMDYIGVKDTKGILYDLKLTRRMLSDDIYYQIFEERVYVDTIGKMVKVGTKQEYDELPSCVQSYIQHMRKVYEQSRNA